MKRKKPLAALFALYDRTGELFGTYNNEQDAKDDAYGPKFHPSGTIVRYTPDGAKPKRVKR